ncbi:MAG: tripartite tricarboxylate transporter substrate binding protein [Betaproteobacteria bacterium]
MTRKSKALVAAALLISGNAAAQDYPTRPIRIIVPSTAGGSVDTLARLVGTQLSQRWSQQVVVDNRSGAGGIIAGEITAKAPADGYTLIMATIAAMATNVSLAKKLPYDPVRDFAPITLVAVQQLVLLVHPSVAAKSVAELIALAKAKPGQLTFASAGNGSGGHLSGELLKILAGIDITHVPYKGVAPALVDVISGQVTMTFASMISGMPHVKSGKTRALAVSGAHHSPAAPELPTMIESGVKGYESSTWYGLLAPKATPRAIVAKLNREVVAIINLPEIKSHLLAEGAEPVGNSPEQFGEFIKAEIAKWGKVIRAAGLRAE